MADDVSTLIALGAFVVAGPFKAVILQMDRQSGWSPEIETRFRAGGLCASLGSLP